MQVLDTALSTWYDRLPTYLVFDRVAKDKAVPTTDVLNLRNTYHPLIILLNRPFVTEGYPRSQSPSTARFCWKKCMVVARSITSLVSVYQGRYTLKGAPYLTSHTAYVFCTTYLRNAVLEKGHTNSEITRLLVLVSMHWIHFQRPIRGSQNLQKS
ncbi:hypothetical protein BKA67DRAFT_567026 [Truncatella angustata]|uniref:Uncharacterized protein n=1 Tax=Truncatella angustata TaxID=152316 RepID=A0A9P8UI49_9PEZI|nr:uncharacterized protein BKA67DRAFT_567026 [Truncatella angustata]KAH6652616.1 hypothetical protein BKA67DRAFT_567026 [Truncatella angustata]